MIMPNLKNFIVDFIKDNILTYGSYTIEELKKQEAIILSTKHNVKHIISEFEYEFVTINIINKNNKIINTYNLNYIHLDLDILKKIESIIKSITPQ